MTKAVELEKKKRDMMELWKETFHDSDRYINLVFDTYYRPENAFMVYDGERLIASLLGVEYEFKSKEKGGIKENLKGLYLCGLATHPAYRRRGIMGRLIREAEESAKSRGFSITFLIPADDHLRKYYEKKEYKTFSFRMHKQIERLPDIRKTKLNIYTFKELFDLGKNDIVEELASWCRKRESEGIYSDTIMHSQEDMMTVIRENENSIFVTDGTLDLEYSILAKVRAVVFPTYLDDEHKEKWGIDGVFIKDNLVNDMENEKNDYFPYELRAILQEKYPDREFILRLPITKCENENKEIQPYAMIKSLGNNERFAKNDNPSFKIYLMLD